MKFKIVGIPFSKQSAKVHAFYNPRMLEGLRDLIGKQLPAGIKIELLKRIGSTEDAGEIKKIINEAIGRTDSVVVEQIIQYVKNNRPMVNVYQKSEIKKQEEYVRAQVINQLPSDFEIWHGPVRINRIEFVYPTLKGLSKGRTEAIQKDELTLMKDTQPDLGDNLLKGLLDALEGVLYVNDRQVVEVFYTCKRFGKQPGIFLDIEECEKERWKTFDNEGMVDVALHGSGSPGDITK